MNYNRCIHCMHELSPLDTSCPQCGKQNQHYTPSSSHLPPLTLLHHKYLIGKVISENVLGITYLALDTHLQMTVTIKELYLKDLCKRQPGINVTIPLSASTLFEENRKRFLKEARMMAKFIDTNSEGVVAVKEHFEENGTAYIVMEYLDGITLKDQVAKNGPLSLEETGKIIDSIGRTLIKIHECNMIHMAVSPDNIMILKDHTAKLLDFGGITAMDNDKSDFTISFMRPCAAPEQYAKNGQTGPWTDMYSLAATMYFCLTGKMIPDSAARQESAGILPLSNFGLKINKKLEAALMRAMELQPGKRFQSMDKFLSVVRAHTRKANKMLWGLIAAGAAVVMLVAFLLSSNAPVAYEIGDTMELTPGSFILRNYDKPHLIIGIEDGLTEDGAHLILKELSVEGETAYNRLMITSNTSDNGYYTLQIPHSSCFLLAEDTNLGTSLIQNSQRLYNGTDQWKFIFCGEEVGRNVVILQNVNGTVLAPRQGLMHTGNDLVLTKLNMNSSTQKWYLVWYKDSANG